MAWVAVSVALSMMASGVHQVDEVDFLRCLRLMTMRESFL